MNFTSQYPEKVDKLIAIATNSKGLNPIEIKLRKSTIEFLKKNSYGGISQTRIQQFLHPKNHDNQDIISVIKKWMLI